MDDEFPVVRAEEAHRKRGVSAKQAAQLPVDF
jgi:hypothetical protein